jgi:alkaline phosphatase
MKKAILLVLLISAALLAQNPKNVILMIGDGMGSVTVDISRVVLVGKENLLDFESQPVLGLSKTWSADNRVTDSAAAGTAMATGFKTKNGFLGLSPDNKPVTTIVEAARAKGLGTGLITTVPITHATPAAFISHQSSRSELPVADEIALNKAADILMGGGLQFFQPQTWPGSERKDNRNLLVEMSKAGYRVITNRNQLASAATSTKLLALFAPYALPPVIDRKHLNSDAPTLAEMTRTSLEILSKNTKGFFLMIEGGQIDWANHNRDVGTTIRETEDFNEAYKVCAEFAKKNPDTLIIVTADHETGGFSLSSGSYWYEPEIVANQKLSSEEISKLLKKVKPDARKEILLQYAGVPEKAFKPEDMSVFKTNTSPSTVSKFILEKAQIGSTTGSHSGNSVPVYSSGPGSTEFAGVMDNTDIAKKIDRLLKLGMFK